MPPFVELEGEKELRIVGSFGELKISGFLGNRCECLGERGSIGKNYVVGELDGVSAWVVFCGVHLWVGFG